MRHNNSFSKGKTTICIAGMFVALVLTNFSAPVELVQFRNLKTSAGEVSTTYGNKSLPVVRLSNHNHTVSYLAALDTDRHAPGIITGHHTVHNSLAFTQFPGFAHGWFLCSIVINQTRVAKEPASLNEHPENLLKNYAQIASAL